MARISCQILRLPTILTVEVELLRRARRGEEERFGQCVQLALSVELTQALEDSACQVVICSPNAARSHWTNEEVKTYKRLGRENRVFCLIVDGEPGTDQECFPEAVRFHMGADGELSGELAEPIAADARPHADGKFNAKLKLIAGMLGVGFDDLKQRELVRQKKRKAAISVASIAGAFVATALAYSVYLNLTAIPPVELEPVSVLIADIDNQTGMDVFDGLVEEALSVGIEGAPHITAYQRTNARSLAESLRPNISALDAAAASLVAVREGIKVVLAGTIVPSGSGFELEIDGLEPVQGEEVFSVSRKADSVESVLEVVGDLSKDVREELGDTTTDDEDAISETFTAGSIEAARAYVTGVEVAYAGNHEQAVEHYREAISLDPNFGKAHAGLALSSSRIGQQAQAEENWEKALSMMDSTTERERLRMLGVYYATVNRNYASAINNFSTLVENYPADAAGHNNLAVAYFLTLDFDAARAEGKALLDIYPNSLLYRSNYALYAMYASDFDIADEEARKVVGQDPTFYKGFLPSAIAALARDDFDTAMQSYAGMAEASVQGSSLASVGVADLQIYRGEFEDAVITLQEGITIDEANENAGAAAIKLIAVADAEIERGNTAAAVDAASRALELSTNDAVRVPAAMVFLAAEESDRAMQIAAELSNQLQPQRRAYGKMLEAIDTLKDGEIIRTADGLTDALDLADLWLIRLQLGQAYLAAGYAAEALAEFEAAKNRAGEGAAVFLDDVPTYRYLAALPYWTALAQSELGMAQAADENLNRFLSLRPNGGRLVEDARSRL